MAWRFHGRATVDPSNPSAIGNCDRCGGWYNLRDLKWQKQWSGHSLINLKLLVCDRCLDVPAPFLRSLVLPPDPPPIYNARVEPYSIDETDFRITDGTDIERVTDGANIPRIIETDTPVDSPLNNTIPPNATSTFYTSDNTQITADNYNAT